MLWGLIALLLILWILGLVTNMTFGGLVHLLLVFALVVSVFKLVAGRRRSDVKVPQAVTGAVGPANDA